MLGWDRLPKGDREFLVFLRRIAQYLRDEKLREKALRGCTPA